MGGESTREKKQKQKTKKSPRGGRRSEAGRGEMERGGERATEAEKAGRGAGERVRGKGEEGDGEQGGAGGSTRSAAWMGSSVSIGHAARAPRRRRGIKMVDLGDREALGAEMGEAKGSERRGREEGVQGDRRCGRERGEKVRTGSETYASPRLHQEQKARQEDVAAVTEKAETGRAEAGRAEAQAAVESRSPRHAARRDGGRPTARRRHHAPLAPTTRPRGSRWRPRTRRRGTRSPTRSWRRLRRPLRMPG